MEFSTSHGQGAPLGELPEKPPKRWVVITSLLLAVALFASCAALLVYRGLTSPDPNNVIYIVGNENWQGAAISVKSMEMSQPISRTLEAYNKYQVPFFLETGLYDLIITKGAYRRQDRVALTREGSWMMVTLAADPSTTKPAKN